MKKIAIFVEGETEYDFIKRLLIEVVGERNIEIIVFRMSGGSREKATPRVQDLITPKIQDLSDEPNNQIVNFQATIYISSGTEKVNSDILDQKTSLLRAGFSKIIGLKDLRGDVNKIPLNPDDLPKIESVSRIVERNCFPIITKIIIVVMEIETWFLSETTHYTKIDKRLTKEFILSKISDLGFNPYIDNLTLRMKPNEDLNALYWLTKKRYSKKPTVRNKTINSLDYNNLRHNIEIEPIKQLFKSIDDFLE